MSMKTVVDLFGLAEDKEKAIKAITVIAFCAGIDVAVDGDDMGHLTVSSKRFTKEATDLLEADAKQQDTNPPSVAEKPKAKRKTKAEKEAEAAAQAAQVQEQLLPPLTPPGNAAEQAFNFQPVGTAPAQVAQFPPAYTPDAYVALVAYLMANNPIAAQAIQSNTAQQGKTNPHELDEPVKSAFYTWLLNSYVNVNA